MNKRFLLGPGEYPLDISISANRKGPSCVRRQTHVSTVFHRPFYLPDRATLNAHSTRRGARRGPKTFAQCTRGPPACPAAESARKDPLPEETSWSMRKKKVHFIHAHSWYIPWYVFTSDCEIAILTSANKMDSLSKSLYVKKKREPDQSQRAHQHRGPPAQRTGHGQG